MIPQTVPQSWPWGSLVKDKSKTFCIQTAHENKIVLCFLFYILSIFSLFDKINFKTPQAWILG